MKTSRQMKCRWPWVIVGIALYAVAVAGAAALGTWMGMAGLRAEVAALDEAVTDWAKSLDE